MEGAENFFKVYAGLPMEERNNVVAVLDNEPINWNLAFDEIKNETSNGTEILKILKTLEII